jgi:hypothetical protein
MCKVIKSYCLKDYNDKRLLQSQFELEKKLGINTSFEIHNTGSMNELLHRHVV